jgi:hypothetical protein
VVFETTTANKHISFELRNPSQSLTIIIMSDSFPDDGFGDDPFGDAGPFNNSNNANDAFGDSNNAFGDGNPFGNTAFNDSNNNNGFDDNPFGDDNNDDDNDDDAGFGYGDNDQFVEETVRSNQKQVATVSVGSFDEEDVVDDDDEEEEDNELWEEVEDDDVIGEDDEDEDAVGNEEDDYEEELEEEEVVIDQDGEQEVANHRHSRSSSNSMDGQRNSQHSIDLASMDNSASVDFDLGSYVEMSSHASDKVVPEDYEEACRKLMAIVQPNTDPEDMIRRCDLKTLYSNLREQYRHIVHRHPELARGHGSKNNNGESGGFWDSVNTEGMNEGSSRNENDAFFSGGPFPAAADEQEKNIGSDKDDDMDTEEWPSGGGFDNEDPFESTADTWGSIKDCATTDDLTFDAANKLPPTVATSVQHSDDDKKEVEPFKLSSLDANIGFNNLEGGAFQLPPTPPAANLTKVNKGNAENNDDGTMKVEKWLERNATDPDDYDYACRKLIRIIYGQDDPDHDPDTMMRRTSAPDLYRYLKNEYWFKVHLGELKEGMDRSSHHSNGHNDSNHDSSNRELASIASDEESARRLKDIEEAELSPDVEEKLDNEKDLLQKEDEDDNVDYGHDTVKNTGSMHVDSHSIEVDDDHSIEVSIKETTTVEVSDGENEGTEEGASEVSKEEDAKLVDPGEEKDGEAAVDSETNVQDNQSNNSPGGVPEVPSVTYDERMSRDREGSNSEDKQDLCEQEPPIQVENLATTTVTSHDQEAELLLELQRLKEEELLLFEEEARLREEAMKIQAGQSLGQDSHLNPMSDIDGNVSEVKLVSLHSSESSMDAIPVNGQNRKYSEQTAADERTEMLERSGMLIREMSSESIIETDEEDDVSIDREDVKGAIQRADEQAPSSEHDDGPTDRSSSSMHGTALEEEPEELGGDEEDVPGTNDEAELRRQDRFRRYTREYNEMLDSQDNGDTVDEDRLYLLELAVRQQLDEELTEDEMAELEEFDATERSTQSTSDSRKLTILDEKDHDKLDTQSNDPNQSNDPTEEVVEDAPSLHDEYSDDGVESSPDIKEEAAEAVIDKNSRQGKEGAEEMKWRKEKIDEELTDLVQQAEEDELGELLSTEAMVALKIGASKIALLMKYFDRSKNDYIYFPSVAKCVYDYSLIDEAEKYYLNGSEDFPMEYATALCTVASYRLNGDVEQVDENDTHILEQAIKLDINDGPEGESVETAMRKTMIEEEIDTLILDAEQQELDGDFSPSIVSVLKQAAFQVAYNKKYRDGDKFVYFPSVAKTVYTFALMDEAEKILAGTDEEEIPPEYANALCTVAASYLTGNTKEVDEDDEFIKATSIYVDLPNDSMQDDEYGDESLSRNEEILSASGHSHEPDDNEASGTLEHKEAVNEPSPQIRDDAEVETGDEPLPETSSDAPVEDSNEPVRETDNDAKAATSDDQAPTELERRDEMISNGFDALIQGTEEDEIDGKLDEAMVQALKDAAARICYVKKVRYGKIENDSMTKNTIAFDRTWFLTSPFVSVLRCHE